MAAKKTTKKTAKKATKKKVTKKTAKKATKKAKKATKKAAKRPKQMQIPGTESKKDKKLAALAEALYDTQMERIDLQKTEGVQRAALLSAMRDKEMDVYEDIDLDLRVVFKPGKDKISVKKLASPHAEDE